MGLYSISAEGFLKFESYWHFLQIPEITKSIFEP